MPEPGSFELRYDAFAAIHVDEACLGDMLRDQPGGAPFATDGHHPPLNEHTGDRYSSIATKHEGVRKRRRIQYSGADQSNAHIEATGGLAGFARYYSNVLLRAAKGE